MSLRTALTLANGTHVDLKSPRASDIDFGVIAEHLSKEARYNGGTPGVFYSVAEHSVRAAEAALGKTGDRTLAAYLLLHDAHEAMLRDDTTPKKSAIAETARDRFGVLAETILAAFAEVTERHDVAIHAAAGLPWPPSDDLRQKIKFWDLTMFVTEWRDLMLGVPHPDWTPYAGIEPLAETIMPWSWPHARRAFENLAGVLLPLFRSRSQALANQ